MTSTTVQHVPDPGSAVAIDQSSLTLILAVLVAVVTFTWQHRADVRAEVALIDSLTDRWKQLSESWRRALLVSRGPSSYYAPALVEEVAEYRLLLEELRDFPSTISSPSRRTEYGEWLHLSHKSRKWERDAQDVIEFLASLALLVLMGRLRPSSAYAVCGPETCRNGGSIRNLVEQGHQRPLWEQPPVHAAADDVTADAVLSRVHGWVEYRHGLGRRVLIVLDVLWSEAARLRDLDPWQLTEAADAKRDRGTGPRNRKRLSQEIHRVGGWFWFWRAFRLRRHLRSAEWRRPGHRVGLTGDVRKDAKEWLEGRLPR